VWCVGFVEFLHALVPPQFACGRIELPKADAAGLDGKMEALRKLCDRRLGLFPFGYVRMSADEAGRPTGGIALDASAAVEDPYPAPILVTHAEFALEEIPAPGKMLINCTMNDGAVVGMNKVQPGWRITADFILGIAEDRL